MKAEATETRSEDRSTASQEQRISDMNNEELCKWIKQMGAPEKTLIEMRSSKIEGAELVYAINTDRHTAEEIRAVRRQLGVQQDVILCMRIERRINAEIKEDQERREHELAEQIKRNQGRRKQMLATPIKEDRNIKNQTKHEK